MHGQAGIQHQLAEMLLFLHVNRLAFMQQASYKTDQAH